MSVEKWRSWGVAYNLLGENFGIIESIFRKNMREILKPNQEKIWSFEPHVGELLFQNCYEKNLEGNEILGNRMLICFSEIKKSGESWPCWSLAKTVKNGEDRMKGDFLIARLVEVRSDLASFLQPYTSSDFIEDGDGTFVTYTKADEVGLNAFLYGMAKNLKRVYGCGYDRPAKMSFVDWIDFVNKMKSLLPEEKKRLEELHNKVLIKWSDDIFWNGRKQLKVKD